RSGIRSRASECFLASAPLTFIPSRYKVASKKSEWGGVARGREGLFRNYIKRMVRCFHINLIVQRRVYKAGA
ncbi:hypothetical protein, partial [Echinicola sediminis]